MTQLCEEFKAELDVFFRFIEKHHNMEEKDVRIIFKEYVDSLRGPIDALKKRDEMGALKKRYKKGYQAALVKTVLDKEKKRVFCHSLKDDKPVVYTGKTWGLVYDLHNNICSQSQEDLNEYYRLFDMDVEIEQAKAISALKLWEKRQQ